MIWVLIFLFSCYAILIISLGIGFIHVEEFRPRKTNSKTSFTVIIPFRNEAENLPALLKSISQIEYNNDFVEFILVDDNSTDNSMEIINCFLDSSKKILGFDYIHQNIKVTKNERKSNSPKKDAITTAISIAKNNWIITTDADCILPKKWLLTVDQFIQENNPKMVVAPVNYMVKNTSLEQFQLLDFMSLQGTTIGGFGINSPFLCNGANLGYKKDIFLELNGFEGNNSVASGDDIFLFEKFVDYDKKSVQFLKSKDAIVSTFPVKTTSDLINQRVRWASKTSKLKSLKVKLIGLLVFLINVSIILSIFLSDNLLIILLPFLLKLIIDMCLFIPTVNFYNHKKSFAKWYVICSIIYPFFSVFIILKSLFYTYNWKGRTFKK